MTIQERLTEAMKGAMRGQDSLRLNAIRMARTAIKNAEIEARGAVILAASALLLLAAFSIRKSRSRRKS